MSLYPPSQAYSQVGYPYATPSYPQPPPQPQYHPPFPPQALFFADPNHFRRDYAARLAQLTFNSRPHIQSLSMIAQDCTRFADIVVQCVEQHIRRVPPYMKLPAFYLLDAMSKNVFDPYARLFAPVVVRLFIDTYESVDQATRHKMEEMLGTWRNGAPNGRELFGIVAQLGIEREVWGGESTQNVNSRAAQASISTAQVIGELEFVLGNKERALQANPYDKQTQSHVQILHQLRKLVQAGVQQDELGQILTQLRALSPAAPPVAPVPPVVPVSQPYPPTTAAFLNYPPPSQHAAPSASVYPVAASYPSSHAPPAKPEPVDIPITAPAQPVASTSTAPSVLPVNVSSLFNKILQTGVLSASSTPLGAGATAHGEENVVSTDVAQEAANEYAESIFASASRLTSVDVIKHRPPIAKFLYERLSSQCKQCGVRFGGDSLGKKKLEDHLDMHFRQNRNATQTNGRGFSRGWFVTIDDWLNEGGIDVKGKRRAGGPRTSAKLVAAEEAAQRDAELRSMTVVVPAGEEANSVSCPICKEHLKSEFNEDDEEWVWRNAVRKDERIYHATCHAEAMASKSTLVTRLKTESSSRSRSLTPESMRSPPHGMASLSDDFMKSGSPSPSKLVGTKRKVDEDGSSGHSRESTPPNKKQALSVA